MPEDVQSKRCVTVAELVSLLSHCSQDAPVWVEGRRELAECSGVCIDGKEVVIARHGGPFVGSKAECGLGPEVKRRAR